MPDKDAVISHTQKWLSSIVIGRSLCPFAKPEFESGRIAYEVSAAANTQDQLEYLLRAIEALDTHEGFETSLVIFPDGLGDFAKYLRFLDIAEALLKDQGYEGIYQLASFHPLYCFEGVEFGDAGNFTNRSPYPVVHILREASIETALKTYSNPEKIPERNVSLMRRLGTSALQDLLSACYE